MRNGRAIAPRLSQKEETVSIVSSDPFAPPMKFPVLIPFLRKLITDKAETPPVEAATVIPVA